MVLFIIIAIVVLVCIWRSYRFNTFDTVVAFTGGLGSGKSFMSVDMSIRLLRRQRRKVLFHNLLHPKERWEKPLLYASIPVKVSKKEMATILTDAHLLLQERIVPRSVVFIDEIGGYCSQFDYRAENTDIFDESVRFFRHYTQGGYLVVNDQCSENIVLQVRRRLNTVYNLMGFRIWPAKWFPLFYTVKVRNITVSEEIKTIEEQDTEDNMTTYFGLMPSFPRYDTYCYSHRYDRVTRRNDQQHDRMKQDKILRMNKKKQETLDAKIERIERENCQDAQKVVDELFEPIDEFVEFEQTFANLLNGIDEGITK